VRLAVFSPLPPTRSGIADYAVELLTAVGARHDVEVFVASKEELESWPAGRAPFAVRGAHDFVWARLRTPFDLVIYQMGNAWCHDYMWPYLFRWPGLVVLHDAHLHHARAWSLLRVRRQADYRDELAFNHPELAPEAAEIGLSGFAGSIYYFWPMLRAVVESARGVAVHNPRLAADLATEFEGACVRAIPMGVGDPVVAAGAAGAVRRQHGLAPEAVVLAAFGAIAEEKRILPILQALSVARQYQPDLRLLLVGQALPHFDAMSAAREQGVEDLVTIARYVDVLDEAHSLTLAVKRLATDAALRARLGAAARAHWLAHHTVETMAARYEEVMREVAARPDRDPVLPCHLRPDAAALARALVSPFPGVALD